eukprot:CAMPEP_0178390208 /NCGR_PEP_ID=MMETSP0689_2-20121128/10525_1 /TAXON_ID=160604 /ORGANISM="Amphidinium massartii, Strain CS-259" /LENGTH=616 /DNA_ID=CAMNT_0020010705 /DNA_START=1 /DNA_END=1851 /DNA_ORIENTATION=+
MGSTGRPASRGMGPTGGPPMGPPGGGTMRPGSVMSGAGMGGVPPNTGARMPTGQGNRPGSGLRTRQGTAAQPNMGVGAMTDVRVTQRPVTGQGVMGMKTGAMGPKRQIYDKTYYMVELRKRCQDLQDELIKLNTEVGDIQQDNKTYATLEKRYDSLVKTVRSLEGDLADHNLATDKQRTDTHPEEVQHLYMIMRTQNEQQRNDIDQIFLEKRSHEEEIQRMNEEIASIARSAEDRLNELHPDQRQEYEDLREENNRLSTALPEVRDELDQVNARLNAAEGRLRSDLIRTRYQQLMAVRKELTERLEGLEKEMRQCSMSVPEQRELLLNKVKTDNAEIVAAEKRNSEMKFEIEKLRAQIREVTADAQEKKDEGSDQQKYEILFTKDQEMTSFIESFDESKAEEERKLKEKQDSIQRLLESISQSLGLPTDVTPEAYLRDKEDELEFKNRQMQMAESTQHRLEAELAKREGELDKIESLDVKISLELQQVEAKMNQYEEDIRRKYDLVDDMKRQGQDQLASLEVRKTVMESRSGALKQQVSFLKLRHDAKRRQLEEDKVATNLEAQESKIRQFGQTLYTLRSHISKMRGEADYDLEKTACIDMSTAINNLLKEQTFPR